MRYQLMSATAVLVAVVLTAGSAKADADADKCGGAKEKAAGRYAKSVLYCNATATRNNEGVDGDCVSKAFGKLTGSFDKAEDAGGCVTGDDEPGIASDIDADVASIVAALAPDPTDDARKCAGAKMKAAGKHYAALLQCYSKGASNSAGPDSECLSRADEKLVGQFVKAQQKGGCTATNDQPTIEGLDTTGAEGQVASLSPVCGDAITGPTQQCDGADDGACPGLCSPACACVIPPNCGDGLAELPEECDDGAQLNGDGCSASCQLENASALCAGVPSTAGTSLNAVLVRDDFAAPIFATAPPLDPSRLFVVERDGTIRILSLAGDTIVSPAFLDIQTLTTTDGERGLLSMAFDPNYDSNRRFYVSYTNNSGDLVLARYETSPGNPNDADESTAQILLTVEHSANTNHNGGLIAFGPDGYVYWGTGDGGGGGDPDENGQDDNVLLGKMLRIDVDVSMAPYYAVPATNPHYVDGSSDLELIWAKGVRNPWRYSFDRGTGDLIIADVGQNAIEEIDFQSAASSGGENYGWDIFEGSACYEPDPAPMCPAPPTGFTFPILEYPHDVGPCWSVTGGYVYRGCAAPDLVGTYFYSDACLGFVRTFEISGGIAINQTDRTADVTSGGASLGTVASFAEDARGELYIVDLGGSLFRIVPE